MSVHMMYIYNCNGDKLILLYPCGTFPFHVCRVDIITDQKLERPVCS
jgi:hypothetical protein